MNKNSNKKLLAVALVAALIGGSATLAAGTAFGHHTKGPRFAPGYEMSKQYVAVTTYKILRDHAPDAIRGCNSDVKRERNRFKDLGSAGPFTRGAINCLYKLGYLQGLPGGTPSEFEEWSLGLPDLDGYELQAYRDDPLVDATMSISCPTSGNRDSDDNVWVSLDGAALSPDDFEQVGVEYRLEEGRNKLIKERWDAFIGSDRASTRLVPTDQGAFLRQLKSAGTGDLRIVAKDGRGSVRAFFEIDGVRSVLNVMAC